MKLKEGVSKVAAFAYGAFAGIIGAGLTGGVAAATSYIQTNGVTSDWKEVGGIAAAGAVLGIGAYLVPSPLKSKKE